MSENITATAIKSGVFLNTFCTDSAMSSFIQDCDERLDNFVRSAHVNVLNAVLSGENKGSFMAETADGKRLSEARFELVDTGDKTVLVLGTGGEL